MFTISPDVLQRMRPDKKTFYMSEDVTYRSLIVDFAYPYFTDFCFEYKNEDYCMYWDTNKKYPGCSWFIAKIPDGYISVNGTEVIYAGSKDPMEEIETARVFDGRTMREAWDDILPYE